MDATSPSLPRSPPEAAAETNLGVAYSGGITNRAGLPGTPDFADSPEPTGSIGGGLPSSDDFCEGPAETVAHHGPCRSNEGGPIQKAEKETCVGNARQGDGLMQH
jgi:hypothetical protein